MSFTGKYDNKDCGSNGIRLSVRLAGLMLVALSVSVLLMTSAGTVSATYWSTSQNETNDAACSYKAATWTAYYPSCVTSYSGCSGSWKFSGNTCNSNNYSMGYMWQYYAAGCSGTREMEGWASGTSCSTDGSGNCYYTFPFAYASEKPWDGTGSCTGGGSGTTWKSCAWNWTTSKKVVSGTAAGGYLLSTSPCTSGFTCYKPSGSAISPAYYSSSSCAASPAGCGDYGTLYTAVDMCTNYYYRCASSACTSTNSGGSCNSYSATSPTGSCNLKTAYCTDGTWTNGAPYTYGSCTGGCAASGPCPATAAGGTCSTYASASPIGPCGSQTTFTCNGVAGGTGSWSSSPSGSLTCSAGCSASGACSAAQSGSWCSTYSSSVVEYGSSCSQVSSQCSGGSWIYNTPQNYSGCSVKPGLTATVSGVAAGLVTLTASGTSLTSGVARSLTPGTYVVNGTAVSGYSGPVYSGSCNTYMAYGGSYSCTLTYTLNSTYALNVLTSGTGTVTSNVGGINCVSGGGTCSASYASGANVSLSQSPGTGYYFAGWGGDCSGTGACSVTMNPAKTVNAYFYINTYTVSASTGGTGGGSVSGAGTFNYGSNATLTATANGGSTFSVWTGADSGSCSGNTCTFNSISSNKSVTANFTAAAGTGTVYSVWGWGVKTGASQFETCSSGCQAGIAGSGDGQFKIPIGLALDSSSNVYVTEYLNHRIQKFNSSGVFQFKFGTSGNGNGQFNNPKGLAVDSSGNIYVADAGNNRIQKFDSSGTYLTQWGSSGTGAGQFKFPASIAVDSAGTYLYVADYDNHRVQKFTTAGVFVAAWGMGVSSGVYNVYEICTSNCRAGQLSISGNGGFNYPQSVAVNNSTGNVYVLAEMQLGAIQKFNSSGTWLSQFGGSCLGGCGFINQGALAIGPGNYIYGSDSGYASYPTEDRVKKWNDSGTYQASWGQYGTGAMQSYQAYGIAVDSINNLYVVDQGNNRIKKISYTYTNNVITSSNSGTGSGTVTSNVGGINCTGTCPSSALAPGTSVVLTATPSAGSVFTGWSGGGCSGTGTCTTLADSSKTVTAGFALTYVINAGKTGSGTVTSDVGGINCGATCATSSLLGGSSIVLTAVPASGSSFLSWTNCSAPSGSLCTTTVDANKTVTANFTVSTHVITAGKNGTGTVTSDVGGINCGVTCTSAARNHGTTMVLTATPASGQVFSSWTGCDSPSGNVCTATVDADKTVTANFAPVAAPQISNISPTQGPSTKYTLLTINGTNLNTVTQVKVGPIVYTSSTYSPVIVISPSQIQVAVMYQDVDGAYNYPAGAGTDTDVSVEVTNSGGTWTYNSFRFIAPPILDTCSPWMNIPDGGGTVVNCSGKNFRTGETTMNLNLISPVYPPLTYSSYCHDVAVSPTIINPTTLSFVTPPCPADEFGGTTVTPAVGLSDGYGQYTYGWNGSRYQTQGIGLDYILVKGNLNVITHVASGTNVSSDFTVSVKKSGVNAPGSPVAGTESPGTAYNISTGTYTVSATGSSDYAVTFSGDCDSGGNVNIALNDNKTCTVTETYAPPLPVLGDPVYCYNIAGTGKGVAFLPTGIPNSGAVTFDGAIPTSQYEACIQDPNNDGSPPYYLAGWAWNDNLGYISLYCHNGLNRGAACGGYDYDANDPDQFGGVMIDADGKFHGYAWGDNVGWISFNNGANAQLAAEIVDQACQGFIYGYEPPVGFNCPRHGTDVTDGKKWTHVWADSVGWLDFDTVVLPWYSLSKDILGPNIDPCLNIATGGMPSASCPGNVVPPPCADALNCVPPMPTPSETEICPPDPFANANANVSAGGIPKSGDGSTDYWQFKVKIRDKDCVPVTPDRYDVYAKFSWTDTVRRDQTDNSGVMDNSDCSLGEGTQALAYVGAPPAPAVNKMCKVKLDYDYVNNIFTAPKVYSLAPTSNANGVNLSGQLGFFSYEEFTVPDFPGGARKSNDLVLKDLNLWVMDKALPATDPAKCVFPGPAYPCNENVPGTSMKGRNGFEDNYTFSFRPATNVIKMEQSTQQGGLENSFNVSSGLWTDVNVQVDGNSNVTYLAGLDPDDFNFAFGFQPVGGTFDFDLLRSGNQSGSHTVSGAYNLSLGMAISPTASMLSQYLGGVYLYSIVDEHPAGYLVKYYSNKLPRLVGSTGVLPVAVLLGNVYSTGLSTPTSTSGALRSTGDVSTNLLRDQIFRNVQTIIAGVSPAPSGDLTTGSLVVTSNTNVSVLLDGKVLYLKGDIHLSTSGAPISWIGEKTIIVIGGSVYIDNDLYNANPGATKSKLGIIALKDYTKPANTQNKAGNIYIDADVRNIQANMFADGSVFSYSKAYGASAVELTGEPHFLNMQDQNSRLKNTQLFIQGSIASQNTVGGADRASLLKGDGTTASGKFQAQLYDFNYLRQYVGELRRDAQGRVCKGGEALASPPVCSVTDSLSIEYLVDGMPWAAADGGYLYPPVTGVTARGLDPNRDLGSTYIYYDPPSSTLAGFSSELGVQVQLR